MPVEHIFPFTGASRISPWQFSEAHSTPRRRYHQFDGRCPQNTGFGLRFRKRLKPGKTDIYASHVNNQPLPDAADSSRYATETIRIIRQVYQQLLPSLVFAEGRYAAQESVIDPRWLSEYGTL